MSPSHRRRTVTILLAVLVAASSLIGGVSSAQAATAPEICYTDALVQPGFPKTCIQWNNATNQVRGNGSAAFYRMVLYRCSDNGIANGGTFPSVSHCGPWTAVSTVIHQATTPWQPRTKYGWFEICTTYQQGGSTICGALTWQGTA